MASRKIFHARPNYIYPAAETDDSITGAGDNLFELDEADVWNSNELAASLDAKVKLLPSSRSSKKISKKTDVAAERNVSVSSASLPVNIPDWSKILKEEYRGHGKRESDEDFDDDVVNNYEEDGDQNRIPPHEYLARRRGASLSVHEGIGRTLKGRDLRRVRNAIWKKTGFED